MKEAGSAAVPIQIERDSVWLNSQAVDNVKLLLGDDHV
jgi:hypothetical protein